MSQDVNLTNEQVKVIKFCEDGLNVFFTGSAGTGKTKTLSEIASRLESKFGAKHVGKTATTGLAALHISGQTIHSWAGIGIGRGSRYQLLKNVLASPEALNRWLSCKVLIIDEISMLDSDAFDTLEFVARKARNSNDRFGGIQIIVCGDFKQLPPVTNLKNDKALDGPNKARYCFLSKSWKTCIDAYLEITQIHRQQETELKDLLSAVRKGGTVGSDIQSILEKVKFNENDSIDPETVYLYPRKQDVNLKNMEILGSLPGQEFTCKAKDTGTDRKSLRVCPYEETISFKVGAKVMLLKNMAHKGLVNGSIGTVKSVVDGLPIVKFKENTVLKVVPSTWAALNDDNMTVATRRQLPLQLAWATTIHKSQGQTITSLTVSLAGIFEYGQAYVALSRVRSLAGLRVLPGWDAKFPPEPSDVTKFCSKIVEVMHFDGRSIAEERANVPSRIAEGENLESEAVAERSNVEWDASLELPHNIVVDEIFQQLGQSELRCRADLSLYSAVSQQVATCPSITQFLAYLWSKIEDIFAPTKADVECDIKEAFGSHVDTKMRNMFSLKTDKEVIDRWVHVLCNASILESGFAKLGISHRMLLMDLLDALLSRFTG